MSCQDARSLSSAPFYGIAAYVMWGLIPLYFKTVAQVAPVEVLVHRIVWSFVMLLAVVGIVGRWGELKRNLHDRRLMWTLGFGTLLMSANWLTFIYAVMSKQVLQSSLGYFLGPLANVLLGTVFLLDRLRPLQIISVVVAAIGVVVLAVTVGQISWIALTLAITGACHSMLRKLVSTDGLLSLMLETLIMMPIAAIYFVFAAATGKVAENSAELFGLLMLGGPVATVPLLLFGRAVRLLRLSTMGLLQYLMPSIQFVLAIGVFRESFSMSQLASFMCIWTAIGIYTADSYRAMRQTPVASRWNPPFDFDLTK